MSEKKNNFYKQVEASTRKAQYSQVKLSPRQNSFLDAKKENTIALFSNIRKQIDFTAFDYFASHLLKKGEIGTLTREEMNLLQTPLERYPYGYCRNITLSGIEAFEKTEEFKSFNEQGILIKRIYGIENNEFHNTIQIGDRILSITDDKHTFTNHNIRLTPKKESDFHTITDLDELVQTIKKYWQVEVYNTSTLPDISMTHPYVLKNKEGELFFDNMYTQHLYFDETQNNFSQVRDFLEHSKALSNEDTTKLEAKIIGARKRAKNTKENIILVQTPRQYDEKKGREKFVELLDERLRESEKELYDHILYVSHNAAIHYLKKQ